ncbi:hypothetical protein ABZP36_034820 [Zizania latifolia]
MATKPAAAAVELSDRTVPVRLLHAAVGSEGPPPQPPPAVGQVRVPPRQGRTRRLQVPVTRPGVRCARRSAPVPVSLELLPCRCGCLILSQFFWVFQETSKFRERMMWRLEQKKDDYFGDHVEEIVDVCIEANLWDFLGTRLLRTRDTPSSPILGHEGSDRHPQQVVAPPNLPRRRKHLHTGNDILHR